MKKLLSILGLTVFAATATMAQEDSAANAADSSAYGAEADVSSGLYGELGLTSLRGRNPALFTGGSFQPTMLRGVLGKPFTPWLNGELMLGIGLQGDEVRRLVPAPTSANVEVKTLVGIYATPTLHLSKGKLYARAGYANITYSDVHIPAPGLIQTQGVFSKHDSLSWGVGGAYQFNDSMSVTADYMRYYKRKSEKLDGFTIGLGYKF